MPEDLKTQAPASLDDDDLDLKIRQAFRTQTIRDLFTLVLLVALPTLAALSIWRTGTKNSELMEVHTREELTQGSGLAVIEQEVAGQFQSPGVEQLIRLSTRDAVVHQLTADAELKANFGEQVSAAFKESDEAKATLESVVTAYVQDDTRFQAVLGKALGGFFNSAEGKENLKQFLLRALSNGGEEIDQAAESLVLRLTHDREFATQLIDELAELDKMKEHIATQVAESMGAEDLASLATKIDKWVTREALGEHLEPYARSSECVEAGELESYAKNSTLDHYAKQTELGKYSKKDELNSYTTTDQHKALEERVDQLSRRASRSPSFGEGDVLRLYDLGLQIKAGKYRHKTGILEEFEISLIGSSAPISGVPSEVKIGREEPYEARVGDCVYRFWLRHLGSFMRLKVAKDKFQMEIDKKGSCP